jgi:hypothetical protein
MTPYLPKSKQVKIGGVNYHLQEWLAIERDEFLFELNDMFGEWLWVLIDNYFADTENLAEQNVSVILKSILQRGNSTPQEKAEFIKRLILASVKSPKTASTDEDYNFHWSRHYAHRPEVIKAIFELNFGPMVQELKKKLHASGVFTPKSSPEPETEMTEADLSEKRKKSSLSVNFSNGQ